MGYTMTEKDLRWNRFIETICNYDLKELSEIQKTAVLCFWYDAEMNNGGHSGYFELYPDADGTEMSRALIAVGGNEFADNYLEALHNGEADEYVETDARYYGFSPSLCDCLQEYVESNKENIFD